MNACADYAQSVFTFRNFFMGYSSPTYIANSLIKSRKNHTQWDVGTTLPLENLDDVYETQNLVTAALGADVRAWKTSPLEDGTAFVGPIYANNIFASGAQIPTSKMHVIGIEGEIAFRINRDLLDQGYPYIRNDILASISEMLPLIELVDTRMINGMEQDSTLKMADNQSNYGIVIGDASTKDWNDVNATMAEVHLTVNGKNLFSGISSSPITDMFDLMAGTANSCIKYDRPIRAGDIITTGSCTGIVFIEPGSNVVLDFPEIGQVEASLLLPD
jgi:2-keto-4-pentenoate hydratase